MKTFILVLFISLGVSQSCSSSSKDSNKGIESVILQIINAYKTQNEKTISNFISEQYGLYTLFRRGVMDTYTHSEKFQFGAPVPEYWPYETDLKIDKEIRYGNLPDFNCDTESWNKKGIFYDKNKSKLLSDTAKNLNLYELSKISEKETEVLNFIEKNSYQITIVDKNNNAFIFYLTQIDNQWFLTVIDRVSYDCSA